MSSYQNEFESCLAIIRQTLERYWHLRAGELMLRCKRVRHPSIGLEYLVSLPNLPNGQFRFTSTQLEQSLNGDVQAPVSEPGTAYLVNLLKQRMVEILSDTGHGSIVVEVQKSRRGTTYQLRATFSHKG